MKKLIIIAAMFMGVAAFAQNQTAGGGISADLLKEISKGYEGNAADKAEPVPSALRGQILIEPYRIPGVEEHRVGVFDVVFHPRPVTAGERPPVVGILLLRARPDGEHISDGVRLMLVSVRVLRREDVVDEPAFAVVHQLRVLRLEGVKLPG